MTKSEWNKLVSKATKFNPEAFEEIVMQKRKTILFYTTKFVYNPAFAEDAAQEVIICMYKSIGNLQNPEAFNVWMHRIILGVCSRINSKNPFSDPIDEVENILLEEQTGMLPEGAAELKEKQLHISNAIGSLPARQRLALTMFYYDEMSYKEIAQVLGVTVSGISSTIVKAKRSLKMKLSEKQTHTEAADTLYGMSFAVAIKQTFQAEANFLAKQKYSERVVDNALNEAILKRSYTGLKVVDYSIRAVLFLPYLWPQPLYLL